MYQNRLNIPGFAFALCSSPVPYPLELAGEFAVDTPEGGGNNQTAQNNRDAKGFAQGSIRQEAAGEFGETGSARLADSLELT
ncbi:MAG TPA: hypothetical protein VGR47_13055 [Terracidiphilus sp.]|nr:hypothetical protein [Terracidiphilus sp.]